MPSSPAQSGAAISIASMVSAKTRSVTSCAGSRPAPPTAIRITCQNISGRSFSRNSCAAPKNFRAKTRHGGTNLSSSNAGCMRRHFMKMVAASPLLAQIAAQNLYAKSAAAVGVATKENVYSRIGVKTIINCRGTWTYLSGSLPLPEVRVAMEQASHHFVNMVELQQGVGRKLAELTGAESGLVTSGAAGAMAAATAACMAGRDPKKIC